MIKDFFRNKDIIRNVFKRCYHNNQASSQWNNSNNNRKQTVNRIVETTPTTITRRKRNIKIETKTMSSTSSSTTTNTYPINDLIPRVDTNALQFVLDNSNYNGKNITIGILDTGIDPGVSTVRYMNDNTSIKLINVIDCTGSGDVDVSTECTATYTISDSTSTGSKDNEYWSVTGLSGRTIKLHKDLTICPFPIKKMKTKIDSIVEESKDDDIKTSTIASTGTTGTAETIESSSNVAKIDDYADVDDTTTTIQKTSDTTGSTGKVPPVEADAAKTVTVRLGVKRAYELFPSQVVRRIKEERYKVLQSQINMYSTTIKEQKVTLLSKYGGTSTSTSTKPLSIEDGKIIKNYDALLDVLSSTDYTSTDNDPGPIYDCIVYYDGTNYRAIIDTSETGNVQSFQPMTSYNIEYHVQTFSIIDQMNYCIQFYNYGTILSIICDTSPHGTHVASIAAGSTSTASINPGTNTNNTSSSTSTNSNNNSNRPGVAPGANLISFKIGDTRISGMETGTAIVRALIEAIRNKCDIINMSYGEDVQIQNTGRIYNLACELVYKHNILFLSSAGNNGPALSTVGSPGGTMSPVIGIAASVSHSMAKSMYNLPLQSSTTTTTATNTKSPSATTASTSSSTSLIESMDENNVDEELTIHDSTYTWSSTGPSPDGDNGVCITAPGGAITTVSNWTLQKLMLMNGTSMSCPNATGCVSLILSACKDSNIPITYSRIRRAIENTALATPGSTIVQEGWGMIQVNKAYEYLQKYKDDVYEDVYYNIKIQNKHNTPRGIYLRQLNETNVKQTISVSIDPQFRRETIISNDIQQLKINYEKQFTLYCPESWVTIPQYICLMNSPRDFTIEIDPTVLQSGGPYTTRVVAYDTSRTDTTNVIFSVPITVVKPLPIQNEYIFNDITFIPSEIKRYFVVPPSGSTFMDISIIDLRQSAVDNDTSAKMIMLHTIQLLPNTSYKQMEKYRRFNILPGQISVASVAVEEDHTIEVSLSRFWSTLGPPMKFQLQISFRGVKPTPNRLSILPGSMNGGMIRLTSTINDEMIDPKATLRKWRTPIRPTNAVISPLSNPDYEDTDERDVFPESGKTIYQLVVTYNFEQDEKGSFTPRAPVLQGMLYESIFESQIILFFDNDKKYLGMSDMKTESITANKGPITAKIQIRHDDTTILEKLQDMILWIERKLPSDISLSAYESKQNLLLGSNTFGKKYLRKGSSIAVFFAEPVQSKLPTKCKQGDVLVGSMNFGYNDPNRGGDNQRPYGYLVQYTVGPKGNDSSITTTTSSTPAIVTVDAEDDRTEDEKLVDAIRDLKIDHLKKRTDSKEIEKETDKEKKETSKDDESIKTETASSIGKEEELDKEKKENDDEKKKDRTFDEMYTQLITEYPDHVPLLMVKLQYLDSHKKRDDKLFEIIETAQLILDCISEDDIALTLGKNGDDQDPKYIKKRDTAKKNKKYIIEALTRTALVYIDMMKVTETNTPENGVLFDETIKRLKVWKDDIDNTVLGIERDIRCRYYGLAIKQINTLLSATGKDTSDTKNDIRTLSRSQLLEKRMELFEKLGYTKLCEYEKSNKVVSCPKSYTLF